MVGKHVNIYIYIYLLSIKENFLASEALTYKWSRHWVIPSTQSKHPYPSSNEVESQQHYCSTAPLLGTPRRVLWATPPSPSLYNSDWGKGIRHWQMIYIRVLLISSINVYGWIIHVSFCKANVSLGLSFYLGFILCWFFFLLLLSLSLSLSLPLLNLYHP